MTVFGWALIGYAFGSFPSAWFVGLAAGKKKVLGGVQRNIGEADAHVLLSQSGGRSAAIAATLDVLKGLVPVFVALHYTGAYEIAACAIGAVTGHCWPPLLTRYAGRGLATAAGVFLAFLPVEMVFAGVIRLAGNAVKAGGLASTIGFVAVPLLAVLRSQPAPYVVASIVVNVLIFARRLEGIRDDITLGVSVPRAVLRRVVLDASSPR